MRLSAKGRFAVTAMIDVSLREAFGPVPLFDIASRQRISLSYLECLFSKLRQRGLVTSIRGPGGGYQIGRPIDSITVADIISAVEDAPTKEKLPDDSPTQELTRDLWDAIDAKVNDFTHSVSLKSLVREQTVTSDKIEGKPLHNRGVFARPVQQPVRSNVPNSVFALGKSLNAGG